MNMIIVPWSKTGYSIYCYIQYKLNSVFYFILISFCACMLVAGNAGKTLAAPAEHTWIYSLCDAVSIDEGLEVRDAQGRVVHQESANNELQDLFLSRLITLLYHSDIHTIALSKSSLEKTLAWAKHMFALPINAVKIFVFTALVPSIRKLLKISICSFRLINPQIPILIFPGFILLILSRKLSTEVGVECNGNFIPNLLSNFFEPIHESSNATIQFLKFTKSL